MCLYVILSTINEACTPMCCVTPSITISYAALSRGDDNAHTASSTTDNATTTDISNFTAITITITGIPYIRSVCSFRVW